MNLVPRLRALPTTLLFALAAASPAYASGGTSYVWSDKLQDLSDNISGPTARAVSTILIVFCALGIGMSEDRPGVKKALVVLICIIVAMLSSSVLSNFGLTGSLL